MNHIKAIFQSFSGRNNPAGIHKQESSFEKYNGQRRKVLLAFEGQPKTMLEVAKITGIERANVCRYVAGFRKKEHVLLVKYGFCKISGSPAGFYKANMEGGN